jgi:hypothetical protein
MGQIRWTWFVRSITREAADNAVASADYRRTTQKVRRKPMTMRGALAAAVGWAEFWATVDGGRSDSWGGLAGWRDGRGRANDADRKSDRITCRPPA